MMTRWTMAAGAVGLLVGLTAACSDSETTTDPTGSGGSPGTGGTSTNGGNGGTPGTGGAGATGGQGGEGGSATTLNGCTRAAATDLTGSAAVTITAESAWGIPHNACIVVDVGTAVTWEGDFNFHPLTGGETFDEDDNSPITGNTPANGEVVITFSDAGDFPYYCVNHGSSMQGVVYVE